MRKLCGAGILFFAACMMIGCMTVPPLKEDGIAIGEIVQRIKCELAFAVPEPEGRYPTGRFQWMRYWTAKVDLTLKTNGKSAITPTAVFTRLLPDFTLGLGAGIETSADRTAVLSFSLSFAEMLKFKERGECDLPSGLGLYGNLGLREWLQSALAPVEFGQLSVGYHPAPGAKPVPAPPPLKRPEQVIDEDFRKLQVATHNLEDYGRRAQTRLESAKKNAGRGAIQETYDDAGVILGILEKAERENATVKVVTPKLLQRYPENGTDIQKEMNKQVKALKGQADAAFKNVEDAKKGVTDIINDLPHDPPINSISHSVNFAVELRGNISPNWTLVSFRGPAASGTFASGTYTHTHTLAIAMGHPAEAPTELARQLTNLAIIQSLRSTTGQ